MAKQITVIGCGGFVGSHVTALALQQGYKVVGTVTDTSSPKTQHLTQTFSQLVAGEGAFTVCQASAFDVDELAAAMKGSVGVIVCAGSPDHKLETIELMTALATNVCDIALEQGISKAVFTSSTGSTNPVEGEPEIKNEVDHWSDDAVQYEQGKYAAVGKTRLDKIVLDKMQASNGALQTVTINPSMIAGPSYLQTPSTIHKFLAAVIKGVYMKERIANDSMSIIDARDLAALHLAALENPNAAGRYFGLKNSWHWQDILAEVEKLYPDYTKPAIDPKEEKRQPTQFDFTRQQSLGVALRDLPDMLSDSLKAAKNFGILP